MRHALRIRRLSTLIALLAVIVPAGASYACEPQPYLLIRPVSSAAAGAQVTVDGHLFGNGSRIEIRWNGTDGALLGTAQTGDFVLPVTIPESPVGLYTVLAVSRNPAGVQGGVARAVFQITGPDAGTSVPSISAPPSVPKNPSSGLSFVSVAASVGLLALGGLGGGALVSRRRTKRSEESSPATRV